MRTRNGRRAVVGRELNQSSYVTPNGLRTDSVRSPGRGTGTGMLGRGKPDFRLFAETNFPNELPRRVAHVAARLYVSHHRTMPSPAQVWAEMKALGHTKAQLEAKHGKGVL